MRFLLPILAVCGAAAVASCNSAPDPKMPWCAVYDSGGGNVVYNCTLPSEQACRKEIIAGNRGQCLQNPRYKP